MDTVDPTLATVVKIMGRTGSRGGVCQVQVKLIGGQEGRRERTILRNVKGPVRVGDYLSLLECEREARRLR